LVEDHPQKFQLILSKFALSSLLADWNMSEIPNHPVGLVVLMEGAEAINHRKNYWNGGKQGCK
jgi:hypothetical protein